MRDQKIDLHVSSNGSASNTTKTTLLGFENIATAHTAKHMRHRPKMNVCYPEYATTDTGLLGGAVVLTLDGEMPVEFLAVGDQLITRDSGVSQIEHIAHTTREFGAVAFAPASMGAFRPMVSTTLAADQMVLLRGKMARVFSDADRALVAARALIGLPGVTDLGQRYGTLFQIFCAAPHVLYCDGLELSTADGVRARGSALRAA